MRIEEKALILPSLYIIKNNGTVTTSKLIQELTDMFNPTGEDAMILAGRKDTKFSQKVRNLKSHRDTNGMADWTDYNNGTYRLTPEGEKYLTENIEVAEYFAGNSFDYDESQALMGAVNKTQGKKKKIIVYDENEMVSEGKKYKKSTAVKKRAGKLRDAAIAYYTNSDGSITCEACGFDFAKVYGKLGKGYIEMHHEHPLYQYSDDGFEEYIDKAVGKMKPVCANCHRIIHRDKNNIIGIRELKSIVSKPTGL